MGTIESLFNEKIETLKKEWQQKEDQLNEEWQQKLQRKEDQLNGEWQEKFNDFTYGLVGGIGGLLTLQLIGFLIYRYWHKKKMSTEDREPSESHDLAGDLTLTKELSDSTERAARTRIRAYTNPQLIQVQPNQ